MQKNQSAAVLHSDGSVAFASVEALHQFLAIQSQVQTSSQIANEISSASKVEAKMAAPTVAIDVAAQRAAFYESMMAKANVSGTLRQRVVLRRIKNREIVYDFDNTRWLYASQVNGVDISDIEEVTQYWDNVYECWKTPVVTKRAGKKVNIAMAVAIYGELASGWKRKDRGNDLSFQLKKFRYSPK